MQHQAALWILDAFHTSLSSGIKALVEIIPIYLYLRKLSKRLQLRTASLPSNYAIKFLLEKRHADNLSQHHLSLENITSK